MDPQAEYTTPGNVKFDRRIEVPFAPETPASGIHDTGLYKAVWYQRAFETPGLEHGERLILHFGAVDYHATVWVNGHLVATHEGGYTPFHADITDQLVEGEQTVIVRAFDDPEDLAKPRGKQDWQLKPHSIWYYRTTGIWQTVWLEKLPAAHIQQLRWQSDADRWEIGLNLKIGGKHDGSLSVRVTLQCRGELLADDAYTAIVGDVARTIRLPDPGIDDYRRQLQWSPESPTLIDARIQLLDEDGEMIDEVTSYTAMRSIHLLGDRFVLNGKPYPLRLVLDQGYWPESGLTAPDDEAFRKDVELVKAMGFNGVRMHQKIENPRFLYWADHLGLLVWEEMPSAYTFSAQSIDRLTRQWLEAMQRDWSHPCIVTWMAFNESWGVPDLPISAAQRDAVQALYHLTKSLDPTRPAIGNDGWEHTSTDIVGIHDYDINADHLKKRYDTDIRHTLETERPGFKVLMLDGFPYRGQPVMLTEFGGIAYSKDHHGTWGYSRARTPGDLRMLYRNIADAARTSAALSGFCYTQLTDTYQEANGLLYMDRTPKIPIEDIAIATRGPANEPERKKLEDWEKIAPKKRKRKDVHA